MPKIVMQLTAETGQRQCSSIAAFKYHENHGDIGFKKSSLTNKKPQPTLTYSVAVSESYR
jgi:hypothetical protein